MKSLTLSLNVRKHFIQKISNFVTLIYFDFIISAVSKKSNKFSTLNIVHVLTLNISTHALYKIQALHLHESIFREKVGA